jgi:copper chaperone|tara:strand:- start:546 stop:755 length:210 start_codon:yes stop_codon:yes gene_type:complete
MESKFTVPEISCGHCKETIESIINSLDNVETVNVDIDQKSVEVNSSSNLDLSLVSSMLDEQGYTVVESS